MTEGAWSEFDWENPELFPWVTYFYSENRNQTVQLRLTPAALAKLVQNAPESKMSRGALSFLSGVSKPHRMKLIQRFANENDGDAITKILIILTNVGFEYESIRGLMEKQVLRGPTNRALSTRELFQKVVRANELTDAEKIEAALKRDSGTYWWKGSGKGWDGQWHRS